MTEIAGGGGCGDTENDAALQIEGNMEKSQWKSFEGLNGKSHSIANKGNARGALEIGNYAAGHRIHHDGKLGLLSCCDDVAASGVVADVG